MKQITILSGKGGVGKSSITASLALTLAEEKKIICADCDVDASNLALVFGLREKDFNEWKLFSTNEKAVLDPKKCVSCKKCLDSCYFNAITWNEKENIPEFDGFSCEGCGACVLTCPQKAINLVEVKNAKIGYGKTKFGFKVVSAQLEMGESGSGKVVAEVKKFARKKAENAEIFLVDSAAGIGCPVIASVSGSDYVIAVTEPSPAAFADLKRALGVAEHFGVPYGLVINKYNLNQKHSQKIEKFAEENSIKILARMPYSKSFTKALVNLEPVIRFDNEIKKIFSELSENLCNEIGI